MCNFTTLEWVETRVNKVMADKICRVITDTPVDRVYKGDTLSLSEAVANQFVEQKLVEIVSDAAPTNTASTAATTIQKTDK